MASFLRLFYRVRRDAAKGLMGLLFTIEKVVFKTARHLIVGEGVDPDFGCFPS